MNTGIHVNARQTVFWIYLIALAIGIFSILSIPQEAWKYLPDALKGLFGFQILLGICSVLIAYWVSDDGIEIENQRDNYELVKRLVSIQNRVSELEKKQGKDSTDYLPHGRTPNQELIAKLEKEQEKDSSQ